MVATPFKVDIHCEPVRGGEPITIPLSCDDVAANLATNDDDGNSVRWTIPVKSGGYRIVDIVASAAGVDTKRLRFISDGIDKPWTLRSALLADSAADRKRALGVALGGILAPGSRYAVRQEA